VQIEVLDDKHDETLLLSMGAMLISLYVHVYINIPPVPGKRQFSTNMHPKTLLHLPHEIKSMIINLCGRAEQKHLRCCCTALNINVLPFLYRTVFLDILPSSIDRVDNIANKPEIGQHVRELIISTNLLAPCSLRTFERQIRYSEPASLKFSDEDIPLVIDPISVEGLLNAYPVFKSRSSVASRFKSYRKYVDFQRTHLGRESMILYYLLIKFINARKLTMCKLDDITKSLSWAAVSKDVFSDVEDCFSLHSWTSSVMANNLSVYAYLVLNYGSLGHHLTTLQIDFVARETWQFANIHEAWSKLRVLKLHAGCDNTSETKSVVTQGLAMLISRIILVRELQISIFPSCGYLSRIDFDRVFRESSQLTDLQVLGIQTGMIDQSNLLALYERHRNTLQTLTICDVHLSAGTWQDVFAVLSADTDRCTFVVEALTHGDGWSIETVVPFCHSKRL